MYSIINDIVIPYCKKNKFSLSIYIILEIICLMIITIFMPFMMSKYIVSLNSTKSESIKESIINRSKKGCVYIIFISYMIYVFLSWIKGNIERRFNINMCAEARYKLIENIFQNVTHDYKELPENEIIYLSTTIFTSLRPTVRFVFEALLPLLIVAILVSGYLYKIDKKIFITFISLNILCSLILFIYYNNLIRSWHLTENIWRKCIEKLGDKFKNLLNILFDNTIIDELNQINNEQNIYVTYMMKSLYMSNDFEHNYELVQFIFTCIILFLILNKSEELLSVVVMLMIIYNNILNTFTMECRQTFKHVSNLIDVENSLLSMMNNYTCENPEPFYNIKFENVSYKYNKNGKYILKNLNLDIKPSKINVIMGKSGSGKTTVSKLIIKMIEPTEGTIYMDDVDSNKLCNKSVRDNIYYVNQRTILFDESVYYNFKYGNNAQDKEIYELLDKYNLLQNFHTLENGLDTMCGVNGSNLSLGMQKIIMVFRGILKPNKNILIFDEPLSSLDVKTRKKIVDLIVNETKGKTLIIISHDKEILYYSDNTIHLQPINH